MTDDTSHYLLILYSRDKRSGEWSKIDTFKSDEEVDPRGRLGLAGASTAYFFWEHSLLVTTNSGKRWSTWSASRDMAPPCKWGAGILSVNISQSGSGAMTIACNGEEGRRLRTADHGLHWEVESVDSTG